MIIGLVALTFTNAVWAQSPRLTIIVGDVFKDSGDSCELKLSPDAAVPRSATAAAVVHESDVVAWNALYGRLTLDPSRYPARALADLEQRCFSLQVDNRYVASGVTLSVNTSFLTGFHTLNLIPEGGRLTMQFTNGNHGAHLRAMWLEPLRAVLGDASK